MADDVVVVDHVVDSRRRTIDRDARNWAIGSRARTVEGAIAEHDALDHARPPCHEGPHRAPTVRHTLHAWRAPEHPSRQRFAWRLVAVLALAVAAILLILANRYGFHRDELYFIVAGRHPDWGYVDQPPITPLLSAAMVDLFGLQPLAVRILPAISTAIVIGLTAAMAREYGGGTRAQLLAAAFAAGSAILGLGHLDSTATYDMLAWTLVGFGVIRILRGRTAGSGCGSGWWLASASRTRT